MIHLYIIYKITDALSAFGIFCHNWKFNWLLDGCVGGTWLGLIPWRGAAVPVSEPLGHSASFLKILNMSFFRKLETFYLYYTIVNTVFILATYINLMFTLFLILCKMWLFCIFVGLRHGGQFLYKSISISPSWWWCQFHKMRMEVTWFLFYHSTVWEERITLQ